MAATAPTIATRTIWLRALAGIGPLPSRRPDRAWFRFSSWKDLALAVFCCAAALVSAVYAVLIEHHGVTAAEAATFALDTMPLALLAWRPRLCEWLLVAALACNAASLPLGGAGADFVVMAGIYTVGTHRTWRRAAVVIAVTVGVSVAFTGFQGGYNLRDVIFTGSGATVTYAFFAGVGLYLGKRRTYVRRLVERTADLELEREILERDRDLMAKRAVAVERARIARELHDVVAHHVSVMVIQAGAAQASLPPGADATGQALDAIRETGREAMAEMRRLLGLLRSEESLELDGPDPSVAGAGATGTTGTTGTTGGLRIADEAGRSPQPGMTDLEALAARTSEAGVEVTLEVAGTPRHIPPGVELSAYRVAQEALTNTLRHAGPGAKATLRLRFEPRAISIEVVDDGRGKPSIESVERPRVGFGHGLVGMRERVALFDGTLEAGPFPAGGYRVTARFPLDDPKSESTQSSSEVGG